MTGSRKFCTACGSPLALNMRFCTQCGHPVEAAGANVPQAAPAVPQGGERILGIVPFIEQGLLSVIHYTLIVTDRRLIFCTWDPATDEAMAEADDAVMQESSSIYETKDEIAHFRQKDWTEGPWQRYLAMAPDAIIAGAPGTVTVLLGDITDADIICETRTSTQDTLYIHEKTRKLTFDLMHSQGPLLARILGPLLGERLSAADHLHRRRGLDRLLSGEEYK